MGLHLEGQEALIFMMKMIKLWKSHLLKFIMVATDMMGLIIIKIL